MSVAREEYVVDEHGKRTAVILDVDRYFELLEALEELESIRAFDEAKESDDEVVPIAQAI